MKKQPEEPKPVLKARKKSGSYSGILGVLTENVKGITDYILSLPSGMIILVNADEVKIEKSKE